MMVFAHLATLKRSWRRNCCARHWPFENISINNVIRIIVSLVQRDDKIFENYSVLNNGVVAVLCGISNS